MAILRSVVDVNNGNTGWTNSDVMDALETVFANLGFNGGSSLSGVPQVCVSPTGNRISGWETAGRAPGSFPYSVHKFDCINQGTTAYRMLRRLYLATYVSGGANSADDTITFAQDHFLSTGDALHWAPGGTQTTYDIGGLTLDTVYYAIVINNRTIKVAANATDAANGVAIDLQYGGVWTDSAVSNSNVGVYYFRDVDDAAYDNRTIEMYVGDLIEFYVNDPSGGTFNFCGGTNDYAANKRLYTLWSSYSGTTSAPRPTDNITSGTASWNTNYWHQTEDEKFIPESEIPLAYRSDPWNYEIYKYIYCSSTESAMKGEIVLLPHRNSNGGHDPYWKYTVPANGGRSELKLRVYRDRSQSYDIQDIEIASVGSGWTTGEVFTIPGDQIGGVSPFDDITFGTRTPETGAGSRNGTPEIRVTNLGSGSNLYQKSQYGYFGVLRVVNDAAKDYGTSYYGFGMANNNNYRMYINSGNHWGWLNRYGTSYTSSAGVEEYGYFDGVPGLDRRINQNYINTNSDSSFTYIDFASTSTPTAYPLSIRVYRAQAPQDTNFAVIQFTQTINGAIVPYGTFTVHKGATFGSNIWDLDNVYLGTISKYSSATRSIRIDYLKPGYYGGSTDRPTEEPVNNYSAARESSYGYSRNPDYGNVFASYFVCNIDTENNHINNNELVTYYRNSTYDRNGSLSVSPSADYYKPIKGLPLAHNVVPCPYYLPDDFVMLQFATTPGLAVFRPGDTVTISPSEVYEVVLAGYQTNQNGLDNVDNNNSIGMLFLARTT